MDNVEILNKLNDIEKKVDALQRIEIKNGGGRSVSFLRNEFFQMLYDRNSEWKESFLTKVRNYTVILGAVSGTIFFIKNLLGM